MTLGFAGAADADIEVGDVICVVAGTGPTGEPIVTAVVDDEGAAPGDDDDVLLPDTATGRPMDLLGIGIGLLVAAFVSGAAVRRLEGHPAS